MNLSFVASDVCRSEANRRVREAGAQSITLLRGDDDIDRCESGIVTKLDPA